MIRIKNQNLNLIIGIFFLFNLFDHQIFAQKNSLSESSIAYENSSSRQDTSLETRKRNAVTAEPDTNFTWEKYSDFLVKISDTSKYIVLPLNEFRKTFDSKKIVIGLRHDVDNDLNIAYNFSETEWKLGFRSTYFILHTAPYYLENPKNMGVHSQSIIPILKKMQNERKFEIGFHNDLVTLQLIYKLDPVIFLNNELAWLRNNGIDIYGTSAHGSNYCKVYHYMNYYFFYDFTYPAISGREFNIYVPINGANILIKKANQSDFNLLYEAYFLNNNKAFSDATITNGVRWNIGMLDLNDLHAGDRAIILLHPIHWHKASVLANIESFKLQGQISSVVDSVKHEIHIDIPRGTNTNSLVANFALSPGAYAKVSGKLQINGSSINNFTYPLIYKVYAENRSIQIDWKVFVNIAKGTTCEFRSFSIPGITKASVINTMQKTVQLTVTRAADLSTITPHFELSPGATAWISGKLQQPDAGRLDFSNGMQYILVAENGIVNSHWNVLVQREKNEADFLSLSIPGTSGPTVIDTLNNTVFVKAGADISLSRLNIYFELSAGAHAWYVNHELFSGNNEIDFTEPVEISIVSEDSQVIKTWTIIFIQETNNLKGESLSEELLIYPNPTKGIIHLHLKNIRLSPTRIEIFNRRGEMVYSKLINKTGEFTEDADLTSLPAGAYILKCFGYEKPVMIIIHK
jgi:hypothetical protein